MSTPFSPSQLLELLQQLVDGGHTYTVDGTTWFDISTFERFGKFARTVKSDPAMSELLDGDGDGDGDDDDDFVDMFNPETGEWNGPRYGEPTRFGDWQSKGRATDFE